MPRSASFVAFCAGLLAATAGSVPAHGQEGPAGAWTLQGAWEAREYVLADGPTHALRGQILFTDGRWSVLFFVLDEGGEPVRASAEGGRFHAGPDSLTFGHLYHYASGAAVPGLPETAPIMTARTGDPPLEPTGWHVEGDHLTLSFPSGNRMTFQRPAVEDEERQGVLAAVQDLFDAMAAGDRDALRERLLPGAVFWAVSSGGAPPRRTTDEAFLAAFDGEADLLERFWAPEVRVERDIAQVWTPYDFHRGGAFSHCGVDAFHFVRFEGTWRVATITYTIQRERCAPSPLGRPTEGPS